MFEMKFKDAVQGAKLTTKLVTAVTILGLATGCVSEQVKNDDPSQDLPALVLNDESADAASDSSGSLSASPEASDSAGDLALDESQPSMGTADGSLSDSPSSSADLAYTPPAELPPLAAEPSSSSIDQSLSSAASSSSTKKSAKKSSKKAKKIAAKKHKKSSKIAKSDKKSKKNKQKSIAKKSIAPKKEDVAAAAVVANEVPPAPPADGITLDGASDVSNFDSAPVSGTTSGATSAAMDNSSGMNLPADPSVIGSQETTTIEPPLVLSQSPDLAANSEGSFLWICFAAGMVVLAGLVFFKMKRRRETARY